MENNINYIDVVTCCDNDVPYLVKDKQLEEIINALSLSEALQSNLTKYPGQRVTSHIARLLLPERSSVEKQFGILLLQSADDVMKFLSEYTTVIQLVAGESLDTTLWWTFSPYIYAEFTKLGKQEAIKKIFLWANISECHVDDIHRIHLDGLQHLNEYNATNAYVLHRDVNHITHQYTQQEVKRLMASITLFQ